MHFLKGGWGGGNGQKFGLETMLRPAWQEMVELIMSFFLQWEQRNFNWQCTDHKNNGYILHFRFYMASNL